MDPSFNFHIKTASNGWLLGEIRVGEAVFPFAIGEMHTDLRDILIWLESLARGVRGAEFYHDEEGEEYRWIYSAHEWNKIERFEIFDFYSKSREAPIISVTLDRKALVSIIYNRLYIKVSKNFLSLIDMIRSSGKRGKHINTGKRRLRMIFLAYIEA